jgi:hypothetical protein
VRKGQTSGFDTAKPAAERLASCPETGREAQTGAHPLLENSTACRKSVPSTTPSAGVEAGRRPISIPWRIPLVHDEHTACRDQRSLRRHTGPSWTARQPYKAFTESLILAQDERWRRA